MEILNVFTKKLRYNRKAERTIEIYVGYLKEFLIAEEITDPYSVSLNAIIDYLESRTYTSASQQNQIIGSLKAFARYVLGRKDIHLDKIERVKKETRLQSVIPRAEIVGKINAIKNLKHKTIITLAYARAYKTKTYVFAGQDWRQQYSPGSCNKIVKAIFGKQYRFHSLRKSSATHRYELGDDLAKIQDLLGHKKPETTRIYVDSSVQSIKHLHDLV